MLRLYVLFIGLAGILNGALALRDGDMVSLATNGCVVMIASVLGFMLEKIEEK